MLKLIKNITDTKNLTKKSGIILSVLTIFVIFISNSYKKNTSRDISNYVVTVEKGFLSERINSTGEIKAIRSINISPRKQGFIKSIEVNVGDIVKNDQILAVLDDKEFIYKIEELRLQAEKQKVDFLRREYLYEEGAISKENFEEFKNRYKTSEAKLNDAIAEKSFYLVKAPFRGTITAKYAEIGSYVAPSTNFSSNNSTTKNFIFELSEGIEIIAKVPESDIGRIEIGQEANVRIEAYPSKKFSAKIVKISPRAIKDNNVTSFEVTLNFIEETKDIKIGMTADLEFKIKDNVEKILVPTVSIVVEEGKKGILIVDKNNSPKFKEIEVGISSGSQTSVLEGLEAGEKIFIDIPPWSKRLN